MKDALPEILSDTDPSVEQLRLSLIKTLTPEENFLRMCRLYTFGKLAALEGLKEKHPELP